jgi:glycosyltransferase involved in cell wall biosynthesis
MLAHISLLKNSGIETYVLQLGADGEPVPDGSDPWCQPVRLLNEGHLYVPVPVPSTGYQRTRFFYGRWLNRYAQRMQDLYDEAVDLWGKPDLLHAHVSLPAGYVAAKIGEAHDLPVIVQEHYSGFESDVRYPWRLGGFIREMATTISGFYAVSPGYAERIRRTGTINKVEVLPNPIDTDLFAPGQVQRNEDVFQIVTTGNMGRLKGTDLLFKALSRLMGKIDWRLTLFCDTSEKAAFRRWLSDGAFARRVTLHGRVDQTELVRAYSGSDLYVVSSRLETANVSMLQAMACGVPVVTTACGAPETLIDGNRSDPLWEKQHIA